MNHNLSTLVNEAASLSARALLHRTNVGLEFEVGGCRYVGSVKCAEYLERQAEEMNRQAAAIRGNIVHVGKDWE
jgi:hypothetical protein